MHIVYIHGASSTKNSFNYMVEKLPAHDKSFFEYDSTKDIEELIWELENFLPMSGRYVCLVGHSLGGVLATAVTYNNQISLNRSCLARVVNISSPLAGSKAATYLRWLFPNYGLFDNVAINNPVIMAIQGIGAILPTLNIVSDGGSTPIIKEDNDGVVSVASQSALRGAKIIKVSLNHFEVLLSDKVVEEVKEFLWV